MAQQAMRKRPSIASQVAIFTVGDVHGCIDEMKRILKKIQFTPGDLVVFLGDLVAKGPSSSSTVRLAREIGALSVRGNHENDTHTHTRTHTRAHAHAHAHAHAQQGRVYMSAASRTGAAPCVHLECTPCVERGRRSDVVRDGERRTCVEVELQLRRAHDEARLDRAGRHLDRAFRARHRRPHPLARELHVARVAIDRQSLGVPTQHDPPLRAQPDERRRRARLWVAVGGAIEEALALDLHAATGDQGLVQRWMVRGAT